MTVFLSLSGFVKAQIYIHNVQSLSASVFLFSQRVFQSFPIKVFFFLSLYYSSEKNKITFIETFYFYPRVVSDRHSSGSLLESQNFIGSWWNNLISHKFQYQFTLTSQCSWNIPHCAGLSPSMGLSYVVCSKTETLEVTEGLLQFFSGATVGCLFSLIRD